MDVEDYGDWPVKEGDRTRAIAIMREEFVWSKVVNYKYKIINNNKLNWKKTRYKLWSSILTCGVDYRSKQDC